ncbi:MAG: aminopeptidase, partial [Mogibacterium sp.]|nr:aminopeptidase [Mogibacterium sp.]
LFRWRDDELTRMKYLKAADEVFDSVDQWDVDRANGLVDEGCAFITIYAEDPDSLKGVDPDRIRRAQISSGKALEHYRAMMMSSACPWVVCSVPSKAWSRAVFPELSEEDAVARMWKEILACCRVDGGDAIQNWQDHIDELKKHVDILNDYNFKTLRYKNAAGTDVTVDLPEGHYWEGGSEKSGTGVIFSPNMPTEEVFTLPDRNSMNGTIVSTKPLSHNGTVIEGIVFKVENGKIVEAHADKGEDILKDAITVDEGASYFGEVALVPYDSPISNSGVLFFNTLFDENASCHFAFGEAYPMIKGSENMTREELEARGANTSMTHVDFMVGSEDLQITGITHDGEEIPVFVNGNFAF